VTVRGKRQLDPRPPEQFPVDCAVRLGVHRCQPRRRESEQLVRVAVPCPRRPALGLQGRGLWLNLLLKANQPRLAKVRSL
jgi:hypothetical protein